MNRVIQIFLIGTVLLFPIVFFWIYTKSIENKANKIIKRYSDGFSEIYSDLNIWVKNFDVFKQKKVLLLTRIRSFIHSTTAT